MVEVVVVGGGIAGCAAALALWRGGRGGAAVTVVEGLRTGAGATGASAGMVAAQYEFCGPPALLRLRLESRARFPRFAAEVEELSGESLHLRWDGMLVVNLDSAQHERAVAWARGQRAAGEEAELLRPEEARELEPALTSQADSYLWLPREGRVDAQRLPDALYGALSNTEVRLLRGNPVSEIRSRSGAVAGVGLIDGRTLEADLVVVAAGAWSGSLRGLPRPLPVRPVRGQILRYAAGAVTLGRPVADPLGRYLVPRADGTILAGSTMEEAGFDQSITEEGVAAIHEGASRLAPALSGVRPAERWAGLRPITPDALPILGPDPELAGLLYATGYGRSGILLAPRVADLVAELALRGQTEFDWTPYRADRFGQ